MEEYGLENTTCYQDKEINAAARFAASVEKLDHLSVFGVIGVATALDAQITRWKALSDCQTPEELRELLEDLRKNQNRSIDYDGED